MIIENARRRGPVLRMLMHTMGANRSVTEKWNISGLIEEKDNITFNVKTNRFSGKVKWAYNPVDNNFYIVFADKEKIEGLSCECLVSYTEMIVY